MVCKCNPSNLPYNTTWFTYFAQTQSCLFSIHLVKPSQIDHQRTVSLHLHNTVTRIKDQFYSPCGCCKAIFGLGSSTYLKLIQAWLDGTCDLTQRSSKELMTMSHKQVVISRLFIYQELDFENVANTGVSFWSKKHPRFLISINSHQSISTQLHPWKFYAWMPQHNQ